MEEDVKTSLRNELVNQVSFNLRIQEKISREHSIIRPMGFL